MQKNGYPVRRGAPAEPPQTAGRRRKRRRARRHRRMAARLGVLLLGGLLVLSVLMLLSTAGRRLPESGGPLRWPAAAESRSDLAEQAAERGHTLDEYPEALQRLYEKAPEARDFVLDYPEKKGTADPDAMDVSGELTAGVIPLWLQWDSRWGYDLYGSDVLGLTGCGPTCLAMAAAGLTGDAAFTPYAVAHFSTENGYCVPGSGTAWTLISEGGPRLGLQVEELPLSESRIRSALEAGHPVICVVGPGDFTTEGHFIVLTGVEDGGIRVNDPNSVQNSAAQWEYDRLEGQIRALWECSLP